MRQSQSCRLPFFVPEQDQIQIQRPADAFRMIVGSAVFFLQRLTDRQQFRRGPAPEPGQDPIAEVRRARLAAHRRSGNDGGDFFDRQPGFFQIGDGSPECFIRIAQIAAECDHTACTFLFFHIRLRL